MLHLCIVLVIFHCYMSPFGGLKLLRVDVEIQISVREEAEDPPHSRRVCSPRPV